MVRDSFIFYRSFFEAIKELPKENQLEIYTAIGQYSLDFKEPKLSGISKTIWILIKPQLDANNKRFENGSKPKRKQNGSEKKAKEKQRQSKKEANNNDNVNDNVNTNVNSNNNTNDNKKKGAHLFKNSEYYDLITFSEKFTDQKFHDVDIMSYHEDLILWSDSGGNKKTDWIATAKSWIKRDREKGQLKKISFIQSDPRLKPQR